MYRELHGKEVWTLIYCADIDIIYNNYKKSDFTVGLFIFKSISNQKTTKH